MKGLTGKSHNELLTMLCRYHGFGHGFERNFRYLNEQRIIRDMIPPINFDADKNDVFITTARN